MKPYGIKRNWNLIEDAVRNGHACRPRVHRKWLKLYHRRERRKFRYYARLAQSDRASAF